LLVAVCQAVFQKLGQIDSPHQNANTEAQLGAVAKSIDMLAKQGVPVPDALRAEKLRLAAAADQQSTTTGALGELLAKLEALIVEHKARFGHAPEAGASGQTHGKQDGPPEIGPDGLKRMIIEVLREYGGQARAAEVVYQVGERLASYPACRTTSRGRGHSRHGMGNSWRIMIDWARLQLVQEGLVYIDALNGQWTLAEGDLPHEP
jgi:hypothetical protein